VRTPVRYHPSKFIRKDVPVANTVHRNTIGKKLPIVPTEAPAFEIPIEKVTVTGKDLRTSPDLNSLTGKLKPLEFKDLTVNQGTNPLPEGNPQDPKNNRWKD
jgi:hypothetical protein